MTKVSGDKLVKVKLMCMCLDDIGLMISDEFDMNWSKNGVENGISWEKEKNSVFMFCKTRTSVPL